MLIRPATPPLYTPLSVLLVSVSDTCGAVLYSADKDKNSVVWAGKEDEPPYVAVGFRAKKTGGKYRYVWLLKAKFKVPSEKYETKGESIKFNTPDIEASFTTRKKDNLWKADFVGTEESAAAKTWFTAVPEKAAAMESV